MTKTFTLENLCCANCAAKIERKIAKLPDVDDVNIAFMTQKMTLEADESKMDGLVEQAKQIISKIESKVVVKERRA